MVAESDGVLGCEDGGRLGFFGRYVACSAVSLVGVFGWSYGPRSTGGLMRGVLQSVHVQDRYICRRGLISSVAICVHRVRRAIAK